MSARSFTHSSPNHRVHSSIAEYLEGTTKRQIGKSLLDMAKATGSAARRASCEGLRLDEGGRCTQWGEGKSMAKSLLGRSKLALARRGATQLR